MAKHTITFTEESLADFKDRCNQAEKNNEETFVWRFSLINVSHGKELIEKLENSEDLKITVEL